MALKAPWIAFLLIATSGPCLLAADPATSPAIARINGLSITLEQLQRPLIESYGLNLLLELAQLELARQTAAQSHAAVSPQDIAAERDETIDKMFKQSNAPIQEKLDQAIEQNRPADAERIRAQMKDDNERAFRQFLADQHKSEAEFNLVIETNALLRKIAEPMLAGKINDQNLQEAFAALYGESVECRHIQCGNLQEVQEARRRLAAGESFDQVARAISRNEATRASGGKLPPFTRQMTNIPQAFKDAAFALKVGEVSDIVQAEGAFHLILLEKRNAPKVVKFEDVKESIRKDLHDRALEALVKQLRGQLAQQLMTAMVIEDPVLKQQFEAKIKKREGEIRDPEQIRKEMEKGR
jgi:foldase protein PrsA